MKRLWIVALVALMGVGAANAQFRFGLKAGVNVNKISISNVKHTLDSDNGCGFTGGLMAEVGLPLTGLCLDGSLMYTHMSASTTFADESSAEAQEVTPSKNFLEIPINLKYKIGIVGLSNIIAPYLFTGPSFAFKIGGDEDYFSTKTVQYSWTFGVGVQALNHLQISAGYSLGINNILDKAGLASNVSDNIKLKNKYWTITAAYLF